jgi:hypothetical protein
VVEVEQVALRWRVGGQALAKPGVERRFGFLVAVEVVGVFPPCLQVSPSDAGRTDRPVVDQHTVGVVDDLDVVVGGVAEPDVGLCR